MSPEPHFLWWQDVCIGVVLRVLARLRRAGWDQPKRGVCSKEANGSTAAPVGPWVGPWRLAPSTWLLPGHIWAEKT